MAETSNENPKRRMVNFFIKAGGADEVVLASDFNKWNLKKHQMKRAENGTWQKSVFLTPGTYEYKFKIDDHWQNDPNNALTCPNSFGTKNSFVVIPK